MDTDICIFLLQGKYGLEEKIKRVGLKNCYISEITIAELKYGAENSSNYQKHIKIILIIFYMDVRVDTNLKNLSE